MNNRWGQAGSNQGSSGSQLLALGLFIMLLAFFIVLNAMSSFDEKQAEPVLESLERTFAPRVYREDVAQSEAEAVVEASGEGTSLERISGLFKSRIPGAKIESEREGALHMRVNAKEFTRSIKALPDLSEFDKDVYKAYNDIFIAVLASQSSEAPLRMDIVINVDKSPSDADSGRKNLKAKDIEKYANLAAILQQQGLPIYLYSLSYRQDRSNFIDLYFKHYKPYQVKSSVGGL